MEERALSIITHVGHALLVLAAITTIIELRYSFGRSGPFNDILDKVYRVLRGNRVRALPLFSVTLFVRFQMWITAKINSIVSWRSGISITIAYILYGVIFTWFGLVEDIKLLVVSMPIYVFLVAVYIVALDQQRKRTFSETFILGAKVHFIYLVPIFLFSFREIVALEVNRALVWLFLYFPIVTIFVFTAVYIPIRAFASYPNIKDYSPSKVLARYRDSLVERQNILDTTSAPLLRRPSAHYDVRLHPGHIAIRKDERERRYYSRISDVSLLSSLGVSLSFLITFFCFVAGRIIYPDSFVPQTLQMLLVNVVFDGLTIIATYKIFMYVVRGNAPIIMGILIDVSSAAVFAVFSLYLGLLGTDNALTVIESTRVLVGLFVDKQLGQYGPVFWVMHSTFIPTLIYCAIIFFALSFKAVFDLMSYVVSFIRESTEPIIVVGTTFGLLGTILVWVSSWRGSL